MSLQTWKAEFYPKHARMVEQDDAIDHSLMKWIGLIPQNLLKHDLEFSMTGINRVRELDLRSGNEIKSMEIGGDSCALCEWYHSNDPQEDEDGEETYCLECPLAIARGGKACDAERDDEAHSPWHSMTRDANPAPMIFWLEKAKEAAK